MPSVSYSTSTAGVALRAHDSMVNSSEPCEPDAAENWIWPASRWPSSVTSVNERPSRAETRTGARNGPVGCTSYSSPTATGPGAPMRFLEARRLSRDERVGVGRDAIHQRLGRQTGPADAGAVAAVEARPVAVRHPLHGGPAGRVGKVERRRRENVRDVAAAVADREGPARDEDGASRGTGESGGSQGDAGRFHAEGGGRRAEGGGRNDSARPSTEARIGSGASVRACAREDESARLGDAGTETRGKTGATTL